MSLTNFPLFRELPKELQVRIWKLAFVPDHTGPLHKSDLFSVYAHGDVPYVAPLYPSFLQELGRMIRFERRVYEASWLVMKDTCHLSHQLGPKQSLVFVRDVYMDRFELLGDEVDRTLLGFLDGLERKVPLIARTGPKTITFIDSKYPFLEISCGLHFKERR